MNKVILIGKLNRDIDTGKTQKGITYSRFSLAVERNYQAKDQANPIIDLIDCVAWRQIAEKLIGQTFIGQRIFVTGQLTNRSYEYQGTKKRVQEVVVDSCELLDLTSKNELSPQITSDDYIPPDQVPF